MLCHQKPHKPRTLNLGTTTSAPTSLLDEASDTSLDLLGESMSSLTILASLMAAG